MFGWFKKKKVTKVEDIPETVEIYGRTWEYDEGWDEYRTDFTLEVDVVVQDVAGIEHKEVGIFHIYRKFKRGQLPDDPMQNIVENLKWTKYFNFKGDFIIDANHIVRIDYGKITEVDNE